MPFKTFSPKLQKLIEKKGFLEPTLPQKMGIPEIMKKKDVLILAPTGSGKTEVACLPIFDMILKNKNKAISALYINPLRSLSRDLLDRLFWWGDKLDLEIAVRYGDTTQMERKAQADKPPNVLITTPETLAAILIGKKMREHLKNVRYVVIDEIHEMVENKRGIQLSILLERLKNVTGNFQRIGISATVGDPKKVASFISKNAKIINAEGSKKYDISVELPKTQDDHKTISNDLYIADATVARMMRLRELIKTHKSVLTFTNTRETAEILSSRFRSIDKELKQEVHHGSLSKESRISSEKKFKTEELKSLISTSSLELGIDIGSIDLVVQYLSPRQVSKFIQRVGRAGHGVGQTSKGIILTDNGDVFESSVIARKAVSKEIEEIKIHDEALDVLATQIAGFALEEYDISANKVYEIIKNAYPYRNLTKEGFLKILKFLSSLRLLWPNPVYKKDKKTGKDSEEIIDYTIRRSRRSWEYYFENLSTIPDTRQIRVISIVENEPIGSLDEEFVAEHGETGKTFVVKGRAWRVLRQDGIKLFVEPVDDIESAIPAWEGELIPVPYSTAKEVGELRRIINEKLSLAKKLDKDVYRKKVLGHLMNLYAIDKNSAEQMIKTIEEQRKFFVPDDKSILIESYKDFVIVHACFGTKINNTIARYVSSILTAKTGISVNMKTDPYKIIFECKSTPEDIQSILLNADKLYDTLRFSVERSSIFKQRFLHAARRFGVTSRKTRYDRIGINKVISQYKSSPVWNETLREVILDKMDIENTDRIINDIKTNEIKISIGVNLSPLGKGGLERQFSEVMKPKRPQKEIFEAFKNRIMHTYIRLVCTSCADFSILKEAREVDEQPTCPKCQSGLIGIYGKYKRTPLSVLKKAKDKKELKKEEKKGLEEIKRSGSLMITYGKKYAITQAGHGVGVETAARILARLPDSEEKLLKYIFEAERNFARTKQYWRS
ncbi:DEAD/DEAH box helicase [Candidatus Aenigmatarchaeota archaeon]